MQTELGVVCNCDRSTVILNRKASEEVLKPSAKNEGRSSQLPKNIDRVKNLISFERLMDKNRRLVIPFEVFIHSAYKVHKCREGKVFLSVSNLEVTSLPTTVKIFLGARI
jgi:hypothetical protein